MKNKTLIIFFSLGMTVLFFSCASRKKDDPMKAPPPPAVSAEIVERGKAVYYDEYPATVAALNQNDLRAQVTGYITGIHFKDGQHVVQGQKLYDIDKQQYQASLDQAIANLNVTKANLARAQQDADRYAGLLKQDAVARQVYDHAVADLESAKMQMEAANSSVRNAQTTVKYSTIYAPFTGTVGISQVKIGTLVTANQTLLNTISSNDPMAVDIAVDQREISRFVELQNNLSAKGDSVFVLQLPGNFTYPQPGKVSLIDRAVDPQTGTIKMRLVFSNSQNILRPGMNVNVRIKNNAADSSMVLIPFKAVTEQMGEYFVFVVNDSNQAIEQKLSLGPRINDKVVVRQGLNAGDKIITEGFQRLRDSSKVNVTMSKQL
ncbi:MAG TPA: efflux RND transporter periplasmic adaptor subunit [Chitinophagaceae bacterium]|nr:efflux RND transporter periplasmic adaptor subunit [Chitinophagaceae bacterium]